MTKFYEHYVIVVDSKTGENVKITKYYQAESSPIIGTPYYKAENMSFPKAEDNMDYARMMEGVNADPPTNIIEEIDDTPE